MTEPQEVVVSDVRVPFVSLVILLLKLSLAAIPAGFILFVMWLIVAALATVPLRP